MPRLLVHVEGETEERFINQILAPHLYGHGYEKVSARLLGNHRQRDRRGGICSWPNARKDILSHLKEDPEALATTMVDYYALPQNRENGWPGRANASILPFEQKAMTVHAALHADVAALLEPRYDSNRFRPYVMMHEFEGLLFSDCVAFAEGIGRPDLVLALQAIRNQAGSPEEINDSPDTAPSKRVLALIGDYQKPLHGSFAVESIGLDAIRAECAVFRDWLAGLETWPEQRAAV
ncbi:MAG: DUF4276 family protein [Coriobacteriia bacterium]